MGDNQRTLLGKQPARILMLDLSAPFSVEVGEDICDTIENLFALACNFSGPSRIPFFSVMALNTHPELLLPFSFVRNNFQRIQTAISDVRLMIQERGGVHSSQSTCYYRGLADACSQYRKQLQSTFQGSVCHQLEIVMVTCQNSRTVQKQIEAAIATLDTENLKRIQVLCMSSVGMLSLDDLSQSSASSNTSSNHSVTTSGLVEIVTVEPDILCLQSIFTGWLVDSGTDSEHMHLMLPPILDSNIPLVIKCDLHERVLQPAQLPYYNQFTIHSDSTTMKMVFPSTSKAMGMSVPIYKLQVTGLVPVTAVCDSLVFGMPMIAHATSCWKIDWDDLEKNQQLFKAVCHTLNTKDQALLAHLLPSEGLPNTRNGNHPDFQPMGHFVLVPSSNGSLLVKCLAVQELILPYNAGSRAEDVSEECVNVITESLDQLEVSESYNPLNYSSNLYESLKNIGKKHNAPRKQKRPLEDNSTSYGNKMVSTTSGKQWKKSGGVEKPPLHDAAPADTPFGKRLLNKNLGKAPHRALYTEAHSKFIPDDIEANRVNVHSYRSGKTIGANPQMSFPTSL